MAVKFFPTVALFFGLLAVSRAGWSVSSSETDKSSVAGVEHRRIVLSESASSEEATVDVALFSMKSATVRVIDNPRGEDDLAAVTPRVRGVAGVNGGYFDPQDAAGGLLISEGDLIA